MENRLYVGRGPVRKREFCGCR